MSTRVDRQSCSIFVGDERHELSKADCRGLIVALVDCMGVMDQDLHARRMVDRREELRKKEAKK